MAQNIAPKDVNSVSATLLTSNVDSKTPFAWLGDPVTGRALVSLSAGGLTTLVATGTIDDSNTAFTFVSLPAVICINGAIYQQTGGSITWTWNVGTLTATLSVPVGTGGSIFGIS